MRTIKTDTILAVFTISILLLSALPIYQASEAANENWLERYLADIPSPVPALAIGDADNDGINEVVIGTWTPTCEVRVYEKVGGTWVEDLVVSTSASVYSLAIGDSDNDGKNEIVMGMMSTSNELRAYEYVLGSWVEDVIADTPSSVYSVAVGDADSDGENEVVCGLQSSSNEVRSYKKHSGGWVEDPIFDAPTNVRSVKIGDCDNDGKNEVVMAMDSSTNEIRAYENVTGIWVEDIIADAPNNVYDIDVGDIDSDLENEVVIGLHSSSNEVRAYEKSGASWVEDVIYDTPSSVWSVAIGDCDNDGVTEVIIGMLSCNNELRAYELSDEGWSQEIIGETPADIFSVDVADADNDGLNEIAIGMWSSNYEVRLYDYDLGDLIFTSYKDDDYVKGVVCFDVAVSSGSIQEVRFYLDNELHHVDYSYPYQYILDTTTLFEDTIYNVKAEAHVANIPPLVRAINVKTNNMVENGNFISINTLKSTYRPDEEVSVCVVTNTPPTFDSLELVTSYSDPNGNTLYSQGISVPYSSRYLVGLPIYSDAELGTYDVDVHAYGYDKGEQIWYSTAQSNFDVSGESLSLSIHQLNTTLSSMELVIADIQSDLDSMSLSDIRADIDYLNQTLNSKVDGLYGELLDVNNSLQTTLTNVESSILDGIGGNDTLRSWLEPVLSGIESDIAQANTSIMAQLAQMELVSSVFYSSITNDLVIVYDQLVQMEADLMTQHNALIDAIATINGTITDAPGLSTGDILDGINDTISGIAELKDDMTVHDLKIKDVVDDLSLLVESENGLTKTELLNNLTQVEGQLQTLRSNITSHDSHVKDDLSSLTDIVSDLENLRMSELESDLSDLSDSVSSHNIGMGQYIMVVDQSVTEFESEMDERLESINDTLKDLNKLDAIIGDINELDSSLQTADGKASSANDEGLAAPIILLSVLMVISLLGVLFLFRKNRNLKESLGFGRKSAGGP
jgi:predicted  nucleic acid-binding Zn-ribbon protein